MNIITIDKTKKIVRKLPVKISRKEYKEYSKKELYHMVDGDDFFGWFNKDGKDLPNKNMKRVGIPLEYAYSREGLTYKRRHLNILDGNFYRTINGSDVAKLKGLVTSYNKEYIKGIGKKLKYIGLHVTDYKPEYFLCAVYYYKNGAKIPRNKHFEEGDGKALGQHLVKFIQSGGYGVKGIEDKSYEDMLNVGVKFKSIEEWNEFTRAIVDFDELIGNKKETGLTYSKKIITP